MRMNATEATVAPMRKQTPTRGAELFRGFLERNGFNPSTAGRSLGVTRPAVCEWMNETKRPAADARLKIEAWTNGEVPAPSWQTDQEREALGKVQPLRTGTEG